MPFVKVEDGTERVGIFNRTSRNQGNRLTGRETYRETDRQKTDRHTEKLADLDRLTGEQQNLK